MAYCHHPFKRPPVDVRSQAVRDAVANFEDGWPECTSLHCDERVNPRRVAIIGEVRCLMCGPTKLEVMERLDRAFVPSGAKQGYTYVADAAKHTRGIYKGQNQNG